MSNEETRNTLKMSAVDSILDGWLNSFKTLHTFQNEMVDKSLQPLFFQKDFLDSTRKTITNIEDEKSKIAEEWKSNLQNTIQTINNEQVKKLFSTWMSQIEEINQSVQSISAPTSQTILDLYSKSQDHLETNVRAVLEQQQKNNSDVMEKIEILTEQIKKTHRVLLPAL